MGHGEVKNACFFPPQNLTLMKPFGSLLSIWEGYIKTDFGGMGYGEDRYQLAQ
jgi:hypothetical protein